MCEKGMCARRDKCTDLESGGGGLRDSPRDRMSFLLSLLLPSFRPGRRCIGDTQCTHHMRRSLSLSPHPLSLPLWQSRIRRPMMRVPSPSRNSQWAAWLRERPPGIVRPASASAAAVWVRIPFIIAFGRPRGQRLEVTQSEEGEEGGGEDHDTSSSLSSFLPPRATSWKLPPSYRRTTHAHANTHARTLHVRLARSSLLFSLLGPSVSGCVPPSRCGALISVFRHFLRPPQLRNSTPPPRMRRAKTVLLVAAAAFTSSAGGGSKVFHFRRMTGGAEGRRRTDALRMS